MNDQLKNDFCRGVMRGEARTNRPAAFVSLFLASVAMMSCLSCASTVRSRFYQPEPMPANVTWSGAAPSEVTATTADGLTLRGYYWPPKSDEAEVILFFHGRSGNRFTYANIIAPLAAGGGVLIADYRGYGDNPGSPTEQGLYADARAFLSLARTLAPKSRIYVFGFSLGAALALHVAAEEEVAGVITLAAFTELADVSPVWSRGLLRDRYDNRAAIARVEEPILMLHSTEDEVVPFSQVKELQALAPRGVRLLRVEGAGHAVNFEFLAPIIRENIQQMPR